MTRNQAAQFVIVGWVKDWSLAVLLSAIDSKPPTYEDVTRERVNAAREILPFLPDDVWVYRRKGSVRRFIADNFRALNDALWDAKSVQERIALAPRLGKLNGKGCKISSRFGSTQLSRFRRDRMAARLASAAYMASRDAFKTHQRSAWNVCK